MEGKIKPIARRSLSDEMAQQIVSLISDGHLPPGSRLPSERDLCTQFGVGRSSLREALRCLAIVGVIDVRVGEGTFVAESSRKFVGRMFEWRVISERRDVENLLELRLALESDSASLAADRGDAQDFDRIADVLEKMRTLPDTATFASLDLQFHLLIAQASKNELLYDLLSTIRAQLHKVLLQVVSIRGGAALAYEHHVRIFESLRARDAEAAKRHMRTHIQSALDRYRAQADAERQLTST